MNLSISICHHPQQVTKVTWYGLDKNMQSTRLNQKEIMDVRLAVPDMNSSHQICATIDSKMFCFAALTDAKWQYDLQQFGGAISSAILCRQSAYIHHIYLYHQQDINEADERNGWWKYGSQLQRNLQRSRNTKLQSNIAYFGQPIFKRSQIIHLKGEHQNSTRWAL